MNTSASSTPSPGNDRGDIRIPPDVNCAFATITLNARPSHVFVSASTLTDAVRVRT